MSQAQSEILVFERKIFVGNALAALSALKRKNRVIGGELFRTTRSRPYLVKREPPAPPFTTNAVIPQTGLYRATPEEHCLSHEVILFQGERLPRCSQYQERVRFELLHAAKEVHPESRVVVHELPAEDSAA